MGRKRTIERKDVLDAALRVIRRDGTAGMSIDAVACEAGICKASVLYDFKTKQTLIHAIVEQQIETCEAEIEDCRQSLNPQGGDEIDALLCLASQSLSDEDRAAMIGLCASLLHDHDLRETVKDHYSRRLGAVTQTAANPRTGRLAFLAIEGLMSMERFGLHSWSAAERQNFLTDIAWLSRLPEAPECS